MLPTREQLIIDHTVFFFVGWGGAIYMYQTFRNCQCLNDLRYEFGLIIWVL